MRHANLLAGFALIARIAAGSEADLVVRLCDNVGVNAMELGGAKRLAISLFAKAGMTVRFVACADPTTGPRVFHLSIEPSVPQHLRHVLGYALPFTPTADHASLNFARIQKIDPTHTDCLLGSVMAHELAHLLFRSTAHGPGLMKECFTPPDIRALAENRLGFSADQRNSLRAGLQARQ